MPTSTTCPPMRTLSTVCLKPSGALVASITTSAPRPFGPRFDGVAVRRDAIGPHVLGHLGAVRQWVDDNALPRPCRLHHLRDQQPDGPGPQHRNGVHQLNLREVDCVDGHAQRLEECRRVRPNRVRDRDDLVGYAVRRSASLPGCPTAPLNSTFGHRLW
jgi:hypothetical protein